MENTLISFETAKLAKQKGFHIMPDMFFDDIDTLRSTNILKMPGCYPGSISFVSIYQEVDVYYAPTQSLLQSWLREVHNIYCDVETLFKPRYIEVDVFRCSIVKLNVDEYKFLDITLSYEDALEAGLLEGLKLIK
jgi:hypothetical protein